MIIARPAQTKMLLAATLGSLLWLGPVLATRFCGTSVWAQNQPDVPAPEKSQATEQPAATEGPTAPRLRVPAPKRLTPQAPQSSQALLTLLGLDASHLRHLQDGREIDVAEQETLWLGLHVVKQLFPWEFTRLSQGEWQHFERYTPPDEQGNVRRAEAGDFYLVTGKLVAVTKELPLPETASRFEMPEFFRVQLVSIRGNPAVAYVREIPQAWAEESPANAHVGLRAVFLKWFAEGDSMQPIFVAKRLEYFPESALGRLQVDFGLFEKVKQQGPLLKEESLGFYTVLAASCKADLPEFQKEAKQATQDALAALATKNKGRMTTLEVLLFNEPEQAQGRLFWVEGTARRAIRVQVEEQEIRDQFGLDHYYQIEMLTRHSQGNPIICCVAKLPPGMPQGDDLRAEVAVPAFYFKKWAYAQSSGLQQNAAAGVKPTQQLAPLLLGPTLVYYPEAESKITFGWPEGLAAALLLGGAVLFLAWLIQSRRWSRGLANRRPAKLVLPEVMPPGEQR